ncbi:P-type ATPase [Tieghemostelium lacteum]|uniref:Phospholipid-transporting ATPase n=1 Tax=Tieghemostelium lacteum TaxID=361077 RepID=A0A152AA24_TIELA|nr:P-type ATPase [Tieghemostelium lacteum]|eukprot:KYR02985.1 P-type ATPase [Tieghemostelium lacteum]
MEFNENKRDSFSNTIQPNDNRDPQDVNSEVAGWILDSQGVKMEQPPINMNNSIDSNGNTDLNNSNNNNNNNNNTQSQKKVERLSLPSSSAKIGYSDLPKSEDVIIPIEPNDDSGDSSSFNGTDSSSGDGSPPQSPTMSSSSQSTINKAFSPQSTSGNVSPNSQRKKKAGSSLRATKPKKKVKPLKKQKKKKYIGNSREIYINHPERNTPFKYCGNRISTTKYTPLTFIPKNLYEQFRRAANFYFLVIAAIQLIPGLSPVNPYTTWIPLIFVLLVTAIKEGIEDWNRNSSDKTVNNLLSHVLRGNQFVDIPWKEIKVGDMVRVNKGERFPADLVILNSSEQHGVCYIETANLDGETNLKQRQAIPVTFENLRNEEDLSLFRGVVECEHPNNVIYVYHGTIQMSDQDQTPKHPLNATQTLLRGCVLRNTEWIYGVVVYTGEDTKIMQNSTDAPSKRSTLEKLVNRALINLFIIMFVVCVVGTVVNIAWTSQNREGAWYLGFKSDAVRKSALNFFSFMIAFAVMIPISLYVSLELVKVAQAVFIYWDVQMYHEESNTPAKTRTSNLSEELGQIEYVFSDKTGTLTRNQMDFLKCSVGKMVYGQMEKDEGGSSSGVKLSIPLQEIPGADPKFPFKDKRILDHLQEDPNSEQAYLVNHFLTLLATCHSVIPDRPDKTDENNIVYEASSPDEASLVYAAKNLGFEFWSRDPTGIFVNFKAQKTGIQRFELLNVLEFNSDRKRMSVILRTPEGRIILYCKGADTTVMPLLRSDQDDLYTVTLEFLQDFATDGLRTLCLAYTYLEEDDYLKWNEIYKEAAIAIQDRDAKVDKAAELIERNLTLIGSTAIEDKLQVGVPQAIANISKANIKVWVLTGDKQETAINIGFSCHLLTSDMRIIILNGKTPEEVSSQIQNAIDAYFTEDVDQNQKHTGHALVVEGTCLNFALEGQLKEVFLQLASNCKAVICCRTTPLQKAQVVKMVRDTLRAVTLAIGDGANDVSMIQAAHIGVGISGNEGMQAVMASDYAIAQFRFLYRLLVVHGRWDYKRNSRLMLYCFYKNMVFAMTQFWFGIFNAYSAQTIFDSWSIAIFNVVFTGLPIIVYAIMDQDVSAESSMKYPQLYASGQKDSEFNLKILWFWIVKAWFHSVVIFFGIYGIYRTGEVLVSDGVPLDMWAMGQNIFILVVMTVNLKLALETRYWTGLTHFSIWGSILIWFIWISVLATIQGIGSSSSGEVYHVAYHLFSSANFWLSLALLPVIALLPDIIYKYIQRDQKPYPFQVVQEFEKLYGKPSNIMDTKVLEQQDRDIKKNDIEQFSIENSQSIDNKKKKKRVQFLSWIKNNKILKRHSGFAFSHPNQNSSNKKKDNSTVTD